MKNKNYLYLFIFSLSFATGGVHLLSKGFNLLNGATFTAVILFFHTVSIYSLTKLDWYFTRDSFSQKFILTIFFVYEVVIMARGIPTNYTNIKELLQLDYLFWVYLIPLFLFFDKSLLIMSYLMNAIYYLGIFFLLMCLVKPSLITERSTAELFIHPFAFGCGFLLLNARYLPKAKVAVAFLAMATAVFSFILLARRNGIVSYGGLMMAAFALNIRYLYSSKVIKIFAVAAFVGAIALLSAESVPASFTKKLSNRLTEDSRSGIFDYFFSAMKNNEVFGMGMQGQFYYPEGGGVDENGNERGESLYRKGIENGYLQIYLNGGALYIILFLLVLLNAVFLGIFKSSNQLVQASAIVVFLWLVDMAIWGLPRLTLEYVLVWICAGICYTKSLRETSDEEITDFFKNSKEYENTLVY